LIRDIHTFSEGDIGNNIGDGSDDMFDGGNYLATTDELDFDYSDDVITTASFFGPESRYFTKKYEGLFVFAAENNGENSFSVWSNYGIDGTGVLESLTLEYNGFTAYTL
jgi:hypothetical protein